MILHSLMTLVPLMDYKSISHYLYFLSKYIFKSTQYSSVDILPFRTFLYNLSPTLLTFKWFILSICFKSSLYLLIHLPRTVLQRISCSVHTSVLFHCLSTLSFLKVYFAHLQARCSRTLQRVPLSRLSLSFPCTISCT